MVCKQANGQVLKTNDLLSHFTDISGFGSPDPRQRCCLAGSFNSMGPALWTRIHVRLVLSSSVVHTSLLSNPYCQGPSSAHKHSAARHQESQTPTGCTTAASADATPSGSSTTVACWTPVSPSRLLQQLHPVHHSRQGAIPTQP